MHSKIVALLAVVVIVSWAAADGLAIGLGGGRIGGGNLGGGNIGGGGEISRPNISRPGGGNLGGGNLSRPNLGGGGASIQPPGVSRPSISQPNLGASRPSINRPSISQPNVGTTRPNIQRPSTSIPSVGGGASINRPAINRPEIIGGGNVTRPNIGGNRPNIIENRPSTLPSRPDLGNIGATRPGSGNTSLPSIGTRPVARPEIDRPQVSLRPSERPDFTRPTTRPSPGDLGDFLGIQRPGEGIGGIQRPDNSLPDISRPDISRPTFPERPMRPGTDGGGIARPDRPSILPERPDGDIARPDRPNWTNRPDRPIGGGGSNNIINQRPPWVNIDNDRITNINNNWNRVIVNRPGNLVNWRQNRPDRVARWGYWGNGVRHGWSWSRFPCFDNHWWNRHRCAWGGWNYWHNWQRYNWGFWWRRPVFTTFSTWWVWPTVPVVWQQPIFYDYGAGGNVVIQDNSVFINDEKVATQEEFAQSAAVLATVPPPESEDEAAKAEWMPLGTFAVSTSEKEGEPTKVIQLAVNRQGIISGTFYNQQTDVAQGVQGQVDKETQRVAFRIGENENLVVETGLYNLTQDETPVLVHYGPDKVEYFLLVRLPEPEGAEG